MQTIKQWLEQLPEPYRTQAIENTDEDILSYGDEYIQSIYGSLTAAFIWADSPQGFDYWNQFSNTL